MKRLLAMCLMLLLVFSLTACTLSVPIYDVSSDTALADENYDRLLENAPDVTAQREAILTSGTNIVKGDTFVPGETYTGTAYYVSNSGNDNNSGTSPKKPWATLDRVNSADLRRGDAVFFQRGGIWYGRLDVCVDEVTYSAYGEGDKPIFSGSDPEIMQTEHWTEYGKTTDGGTVWEFSSAKTDVAHILMNGGEIIAHRMTPDYTGDEYVDNGGQPYDVLTQLTENLSYFCELDLTGWELSQAMADESHPAKLYLRCDAGNPAEIFSEIQVAYTLFAIANEYCGTVIDNLHIQNYGSLAVSGGMGRLSQIKDEYVLAPSITVQNCEIDFCGGSISKYNAVRENLWRADFSGGALQLSGNGNRAMHNYIHDVDSKVFVIVHIGAEDQGPGYENVTISHNLLENNCCAFHFTDYTYWVGGREAPSYFKNINVTDNTILYTGYGWFRELEREVWEYPWCPNLACVELRGGKHAEDSIRFANNLFYGAELCLVFNPLERDSRDMPGAVDVKMPEFSGNTYVQYGYSGMHLGNMYPAAALESYVRDILGDCTGTVIGK